MSWRKAALESTHCFLNYKDKLLCYSPYGIGAWEMALSYNEIFHNLAWKLYQPLQEFKNKAEILADNKGCNIVISGYTNADDYIKPLKNNVWKIEDDSYKKIIWAPHFTISKGIGLGHVSNFLVLAEFMKKIAIEYSAKIEIAFKPHPRLYTELCKHPEWGKEKAKEYYNFWRNFPTTQLEEGEFIELFKQSDALIHDSCSFTIEYLFVNKPVLYDNPDYSIIKNQGGLCINEALAAHYKVSSSGDIRKFIDDVVLGGNDPMKAQRVDFFKKYLLPPNGKTVAQNIYDDMLNSLNMDGRA